MKEERESLEVEVTVNQEKHKVAYARVDNVVNHLIELYQQAEKSILSGKDHQEVLEALNNHLLALRPIKTVREHFVHFYRKLSNLIRRLQNCSRKDNLSISRYSKRKQSNGNASECNQSLNVDRVDRFFDQFISGNEQHKALQILITEHFLREGRQQCASVWQNYVKIIDPNHLFMECSRIKEMIKQKKFQEAISWCISERLFETKFHLLQYDLIKAQIVNLVDLDQSQQALRICSKQLKKFEEICEEDIKKLISYILFKEQRFWGSKMKQLPNLTLFCSNRYSNLLLTSEKCEQLANNFEKIYLKQNNISYFNVLKVIYNCSRKIEQQYKRLLNLSLPADKRKQTFKIGSTLPFSIKLDQEYQYHSLFLCPISKEVQSSGQSSILLSCGHLISSPAFDRITLENRRRRVKCPVCQKDTEHQGSMQIQF